MGSGERAPTHAGRPGVDQERQQSHPNCRRQPVVTYSTHKWGAWSVASANEKIRAVHIRKQVDIYLRRKLYKIQYTGSSMNTSQRRWWAFAKEEQNLKASAVEIPKWLLNQLFLVSLTRKRAILTKFQGSRRKKKDKQKEARTCFLLLC